MSEKGFFQSPIELHADSLPCTQQTPVSAPERARALANKGGCNRGKGSFAASSSSTSVFFLPFLSLFFFHLLLFLSSLSPPLLPPSLPLSPPPSIKATSPSQVLLISPVALADTVDMHSKLNSRLINKAEAVCPTGRYFFICLQPSPADDSPLCFSKGTQGHQALATQLFFLFKLKKTQMPTEKKSSQSLAFA